MADNFVKIGNRNFTLDDNKTMIIMKLLGLSPKKDLYKRVPNGSNYFYISDSGGALEVDNCYEEADSIDDGNYNEGNYFTTEAACEEAINELKLHLLLKRYAALYNSPQGNPWNGFNKHYFITYDTEDKSFVIGGDRISQCAGLVYFDTKEITQQAIDKYINLLKEVYHIDE